VRETLQLFATTNSAHTAPTPSGLSTVLIFVRQQSYVLSLFAMMVSRLPTSTTPMSQAWSIMYHSWFTFVLLLISCAVWIVPDSRSLSLRLSPFVVGYSQVSSVST
jgi:hypothetical protein